jgi:Leucine-rich repeat (LRR) protein
LSRLTGLRELDMQRLGLHAIPAAVADLTRLTSLYLTGNNIEEIPPWIVSLVCLRVLDLRLNSLTGALPPCVLALTALTELRLGRNRFLIRTDVLRVLKRRGVEIGLSSDA